MRKRLLSFLLCVCMVLTLMPCTAFAADPPTVNPNEKDGWCGTDANPQGVHWQLIENGTPPTSLPSGKGLTLVLSGNNKGNTAIRDYTEDKAPWNDYRDYITKIEFVKDTTVSSNQVTTIGNYAFSKLENVTEVTIPEGVESIGSNAFFGCKRLEKVVLPQSVTSIGECAFMECPNLTEITIPGTIKEIKKDTFNGCASLTTIRRNPNPNNSFSDVEKVGDDAFRGCAALTTIKLPYVGSIGERAFMDCTKLETVQLPELETVDFPKDDPRSNFTVISASLFENCGSLKVIDIPWTVETIQAKAFFGTKLSDIWIPPYVTTIGDWAFANITDNKTVTLTPTELDEHDKHLTRTFKETVFNGSQLGTVTIHPDCGTIENGLFKECSINTVHITYTVTEIQPDAFTETDGITAFVVDEHNQHYKSVKGVLFNYRMTELIRYPVASKTTTYAIPEQVSTIKTSAFYNSQNLTSVTFPRVPTTTPITIESNAFKDCEKLTSVTLTDRVKTIGDSAFENTGLTGEITIPDTVTSLGKSVFKGCAGLTGAHLSYSLTALPASAFENCTALAAITIPARTIKIGDSAFANCTSLSSADLGVFLEEIGNKAFMNCSKLTAVNLHSALTTIGASAFEGSGLTAIGIPESVTSIGESAFKGCKDMEYANIPGGGQDVEVGDCAFENCVSLAEVYLDARVNQLGNAAFKGCTELQRINLPSDLEKIPAQLFYGCEQLGEVVFIPRNVKTIESGAFAYSGVKQVHLYPALKTIEGSQDEVETEDAFIGSKLNEILYHGSEDDWKNVTNKDESVAYITSSLKNITYNVTASSDDSDPSTPSPDFYVVTFLLNSNNDKNSWILGESVLHTDPDGRLNSRSIPDASRTGYNFLGWTLDKAGTQKMPEVFEKDTVLYAQWELIPIPTYTITVQGGGVADKASAEAGERVRLRAPAMGTNEEFIGWNFNYSPVEFADGYDSGKTLTYFIMPAQNVTVSCVTKVGDKILVNSTYYIVRDTLSGKGGNSAQKVKDLLDSALSSGDRNYYYDIELKTTTTTHSADADEDGNTPVALTARGAFGAVSGVYAASGQTTTVVIPYPTGTSRTTHKFSAAIVDSSGAARSIAVTPTERGLELSVSDASSVKIAATKIETTTPTNPTTPTTPTTPTPTPTPVYYTIRDNSSKGGTVTVVDEAEEDDTVTIKVKPKDGYELEELVVYGKNNKELKLKEKSDDKFTFTMPANKVTVEATFVEEKVTQNTTSNTDSTASQLTAEQLFGPGVTGVAGIPDTVTGTSTGTASGTAAVNVSIPFTDVPATSASRAAIGYVYSKGLMSGTSATAFSPDTTISRAMIVSILYRLEGSPSAVKASFEDVEEGEWYETPVAWASENGIVSGYNDGNFGPEDPVTKEQLVSILARYALLKKYDTVARADISEYNDSDKVSQYALGAMQWAAGKQLFAENSLNLLNPTNEVSREQAADMLMRFCQNVAKLQ